MILTNKTMCLEYHKGQPCVYKPILCQEGYCSECGVYYRSLLHSESLNEDDDEKNLSKVKNLEF